MIRVARDAVGMTFGVIGLVVDTALGAANQVRRTATGLLTRGRCAADKAAAEVRDTAYDTAAYADEKADAAVDKVVEVGEDLADALDEPDRRPYEERTYAELYDLATERDIAGRSNMSKAELIEALREER